MWSYRKDLLVTTFQNRLLIVTGTGSGEAEVDGQILWGGMLVFVRLEEGSRAL